jgi:hypothetical protein
MNQSSGNLQISKHLNKEKKTTKETDGNLDSSCSYFNLISYSFHNFTWEVVVIHTVDWVDGLLRPLSSNHKLNIAEIVHSHVPMSSSFTDQFATKKTQYSWNVAKVALNTITLNLTKISLIFTTIAAK